MSEGHGYEDEERASAASFRDAAEGLGLERIVYLGGMPPKGTPSRHLHSRTVTGEIFHAACDSDSCFSVRSTDRSRGPRGSLR